MSMDDPSINPTNGNTTLPIISSGSVLRVIDDNFTLVCVYNYLHIIKCNSELLNCVDQKNIITSKMHLKQATLQ